MTTRSTLSGSRPSASRRLASRSLVVKRAIGSLRMRPDGPGREAGVEEEDRVGSADEPAGDGDLDPLARELAEEEPGALEAQEAVLQRVERLDRHAATF